MSVELVKTLSHTLTESELTDEIGILIDARKNSQNAQILEMKNTLKKNDIVEFYHSARGKYIRGTVKKTKTKKALVVEEGTTMTWDVPMGMLRKVQLSFGDGN